MTPDEIQRLHDSGMTQRKLAKILHVSTAIISPYLKSLGIVTRKRGGDWSRRSPSQIANAKESRANGDNAIRAKFTPRRPCPHGVTLAGKPLDCTLALDGCDPVSCVGSRSVEGRVSVVSSFGREAVVLGGGAMNEKACIP